MARCTHGSYLPEHPGPHRERSGPRGTLVPSAQAWRIAACLAPSRPNAANVWDKARGQPPGPDPFLPAVRDRTNLVGLGRARARAPRRGRRRALQAALPPLTCRDRAAAAGSRLPPGPA